MVKQFEITWGYNCIKGSETRFMLYVKHGDQWKLIKELDSHCDGSEDGYKSFKQLVEHDAPVGKEFILGLSAVNQAGESEKIEYLISIPIPDPESPENFTIKILNGGD